MYVICSDEFGSVRPACTVRLCVRVASLAIMFHSNAGTKMRPNNIIRCNIPFLFF